MPRSNLWKKFPEDMERWEQIISTVRPDLVVETGTWHGEMSRWFAKRVPQVITIDMTRYTTFYESNIEHIIGNSIDPWYVETIQEELGHTKTLVDLDSAHTTEHVLKELKLYAPLVSLGSYLVVEDTIHHWRDDFKGDDPMTALDNWYYWSDNPVSSRFMPDFDIQNMSEISANPYGWLKRVR